MRNPHNPQKELLLELSKRLYQARETGELLAVQAYLKLKLEVVKEALVGCRPDDFQKLQGEAMTYTDLIRLLTRPAATITPEKNDG